MKKVLSIFGTCVVTDVFLHATNDSKMEYLIRNNAYQINPISVVDERKIEFLADLSIDGRWERSKKSLEMDINKDLFEIFESKRSDYLVIDLASFIFPVLQILDVNGNEIGLITWTPENRKYNEQKIINKILQSGYSYNILNSETYSNTLPKIIKKFCDKISKIWSANRVILINVKPVNQFISSGGELLKIPNAKSLSFYELMNKAFELFCAFLPGIHIINPLIPMFSSYDAMWGKAEFHAHKIYYDYVYECINKITEFNNDDSGLELLKDDYSKIMFELYQKSISKLLDKYYSSRRIAAFEIKRHQAAHVSDNYLNDINHYYNRYIPPSNSHGEYFDLLHTKTLNDFTEEIIGNTDIILLVSVCDSADKYYSNWIKREKLGLKKNLLIHEAYIAIIDGNGHVIEDFMQNGACHYSGEILVQDRYYWGGKRNKVY